MKHRTDKPKSKGDLLIEMIKKASKITPVPKDDVGGSGDMRPGENIQTAEVPPDPAPVEA